MRLNAGQFQTTTVGSLIALRISAHAFSLALVGMRRGRNTSMPFGFRIMWADTTWIIMHFVRSRVDEY